jgi:hypothetical protein
LRCSRATRSSSPSHGRAASRWNTGEPCLLRVFPLQLLLQIPGVDSWIQVSFSRIKTGGEGVLKVTYGTSRNFKGLLAKIGIIQQASQWWDFVLPVLTHSLTHGDEPYLRSCKLCSHSRTSQRFMEPDCSLPRSQEPSTSPDTQPDRSNPHHPILPL